MKSIQQKSSHTKWECKYHIVWIPKYRKKKLYKELRQYLGEMFRDLAGQKECTIEEGHLMGDHVHMLISIPPGGKGSVTTLKNPKKHNNNTSFY